MDDSIMLTRREHRAVVLTIASAVANQLLLEQIREVAASAGLTDEEVEAIVSRAAL